MPSMMIIVAVVHPMSTFYAVIINLAMSNSVLTKEEIANWWSAGLNCCWSTRVGACGNVDSVLVREVHRSQSDVILWVAQLPATAQHCWLQHHASGAEGRTTV